MSPLAVAVPQAGVRPPELYWSSVLLSWTIAWPVAEFVRTPHGSFPAKPLSSPSASAMVLVMGVGSEPFARLSFAAMSWRATIKLGSPCTGVVRMVSNSACV